jgi:hypothetical protein
VDTIISRSCYGYCLIAVYPVTALAFAVIAVAVIASAVKKIILDLVRNYHPTTFELQ